MEANRRRMIRLIVLATVVIALITFGFASGVRERLTIDSLRAMTTSAGSLGALLFIAAFCLGQLLYLPGMVFVVAGVLAYGRVWGGALSFTGALISISFTFVLVRGAGGSPLAGLKRPFLRRALARLDTHPVSTVALLRLVFLTSPLLNYLLALSPLRFRHHLAGSALGIALPTLAVALFTEEVVRYLTAK
ncbi:MAG: DedA family protein [Myxococcales bacterium]|nr:DedA family protein [Myxococcales bacterium]